MKNFTVAFLCVFLAVIVAEHFNAHKDEMLISKSLECSKQKKIPAEKMAKYHQLEFPNDEITRAYIECILEKAQLFDPKKGFHVANLIKQLTKEKGNNDELKASIEKCADKNEEKSDANTWAYRGLMCFMSKDLPTTAPQTEKKAKN